MRKILFLILICLVFSTAVADLLYAQIVLDGTMGTAGEIKGPVYDIKAGYGKQAGANLFHSFGQFNVSSGETADFRVSPAIQNIISRVTGGEFSRIDGTLRSTLSGSSEISGANLYLLNPAGVMFGQNARLDIGGSFHVSTADYLRMGKDERFNAVEDVELLSTEPPAAFGFLDSDIASITVEGKGEMTKQEWENNSPGLRVEPGNTLSLIGGDIEIKNGAYYDDVKTGDIAAPEGRINMASVASPGEAVLTDDDVDVSSFQKMGNITLSDNATASVSGNGSGDIFIRTGGFFAYSGSSVEADTAGDENGGRTDIQADTLSLNASSIFSDAEGKGRGGDISIRVSGNALISDSGRIFADATGEGAATGSAGGVSIEAENISLNEGVVSSETYGKSSSGTVTLQAQDSIDISGSGQIFARSTGKKTDTAAGDGGTVLIETRHLSLSEKSRISTDTYKDGIGGNITVTGPGGLAAESVDISSDSRIYAGTKGSGQGGAVLVETDSLSLSGNGKIDSESLSMEPDAGIAGDINIIAKNVSLTDQGIMTANTQGPGTAGSIVIDTDRLVLGSASEISSASTSKDSGGDAGTVTINAADSVSLSHSKITTQAEDAGKGQIDIQTGKELYLFNSEISTSIKKGENDAGNIRLSQDFLILNKSAIVANAYQGKGGNINIKADEAFIRSSDSRVDASSQLGIDG
ncbi:MAG: hypothetical protein BWK80_18220, partial [Desulfobacteraceae bacterium IS3]